MHTSQAWQVDGGRWCNVLRSFKDLQVWQKGYRLGLRVYQLTKSFPDQERFGITAQLRRCAVSVPSNIAEGYGRFATADYVRFLRIARGSLAELETQLMLSADLGYADRAAVNGVIEAVAELERMLNALIRSLRDRAARSS
jgi:four helix bundle protein